MVRRAALANYKMATPAGRAGMLFVSLLTIVMIALLYRTQSNAAAIRENTAAIAQSGRGINDYTDSILQLNTTNELAASIAKSLQPLESSLTGISDSAAQIDQGLDSIKTSSGSIEISAGIIDTNATAIRQDVAVIGIQVGRLNATLGGINANAGSILATASTLERGIGLISSNLGRASTVVRRILQDAKGINTRMVTTEHLASCIDNGLNGNQPC